MKNIFTRFLFVALALVIATSLSLFALAEDETSVTSDASSVSETSAASSADASSTASTDTGSAESSAVSSTSSVPASTSSDATSEDTLPNEVTSDFPWARVITLIVIVVLIAVAFVLSKTNTKLGMKISKFFKDYKSEIKKIVWLTPKDTMKATGVVLVFIITAAVAIGLLDLGFTQLIKLLASIG